MLVLALSFPDNCEVASQRLGELTDIYSFVLSCAATPRAVAAMAVREKEKPRTKEQRRVCSLTARKLQA